MNGMDNNSIKDNIYRFRKAKGYTQEEMASRIGTSITTYRSIENGKTNLIHPMVRKIAEVLGTSEEDLFIETVPDGKSNLEDDGVPYLARKPESDLLIKMREDYERRLQHDRREIDSLKEIVRSKETIIDDLSGIVQMLKKIMRSDNGG